MANLLDSKGNLEELSGVERIKVESDGLYGAIAEELGQASGHFEEETIQLLKHHGTYQQDNRDTRRDRKKQGLDKDYTMMVRTKFPGGRLNAEQYILCDDLCTKYGQNDLRATSRQDFQFHGVVKGNLHRLIHDLNTLGRMCTLGGCGDVVRNTMAAPVADIDPRYKDAGQDLLALAERISSHFMPRTTAYFDLWIDGEKARVNDDGTVTFERNRPETAPAEPLYGKHYLPRKFKIGLGADFDNSVDLYTQDVGVMAVTENGAIVGYEILAGGGLGFSHAKADTYPRAATPLAFVQHYDVVPVCEAIVKVQRDYGERTNRQQARLKYTIDRLGEARFRELVEQYAGRSLDPPRGVKPSAQPDYLGWRQQIQDGLNYVGVWIENGRIKDFEGGFQFKSGLRAVIERFRPDVRVTPHHNLILANIPDEDVDAVQAMLDEYGIPTDKGISQLRRLEMACPALPLCGLAQSEAERVMPEFIRGLEEAGHGGLDVSFRMTGCPNGCARSVMSEIGLAGKGVGRYTLYVGGDYNGTRIAEEFLPVVKHEDVVLLISRLFTLWLEQRDGDERFGDWSHRVGAERIRQRLGIEMEKKK